MANKFFSAAIMIAAVCAFCACDKEALTPMEASNGYDSNAGKVIKKVEPKDDKIVSYTYTDAFERFVEGGTEYSFIPVTVYEKKGEVKGERIFIVDPFNHKGIDPQQLSRQKPDTLKTSFGSSEPIHEDLAKTAQEGWWKEVSGKVQNFSATNGADVVAHNTTTTVASMVYRAHNDSLVVEFPAPSFTLSESTSHADLGNALEYRSKVVATLSILEAFRKAGESSTKELVATNVAVLTNVPDNYTQEFEAKEYVGNFKVSNVSNFETEDQHNAYVRRTYNNGQLTEEKTFNLPLVLSAKLTRTSGARENVEEFKNNLGVSMALAGAAQTTFGEPDENGYRAQRVTRNYTLRVSDGARYNLEVIVENTVKNGEDVLEYAWFNEIEPVISLQPKLNSAESTTSNPVSDVEVSVNLNVARTTRGQVQTKAAADEKEPYIIKASHQEVMTVADELVSSREEKVVTPKANGFDIVARFFETYSLSGEKMVSEQSGEMLFDINGSNGTAMVVKNVNFTTTGNGHNGIGNGTYSNTATNGTDSFNNSYSYSADNSKSFSYNGKTVTFTADFKIVENGQSIGSKTSSNGYDVYPYSNEVKGIYTVDGQSVEKTAAATRELRVEQVVENLIGDIVSAGMSVVPSLKSGSSYVDGSGKRVATKCLTIRRANGTAAAIVFAYETENVILPTDAQIKGGNWVSGNYTNAYNSGVYMNGNWVPAVAKDENYGISYSIPTQSNIRSIRNETLKQWGWRGGNYSTKLSAYNVTVENGVCTIYYNGEVVKRFR